MIAPGYCPETLAAGRLGRAPAPETLVAAGWSLGSRAATVSGWSEII
jgi:hypothetical protein